MNNPTEDTFKATVLAEQFGSSPLGFIDIGARGGVHETVDPVAPFVSVLGFEPDPEECKRMLACLDEEGSRYANVDLEPVGLGGYNGTATLHRITVPTNDSLRMPNARTVARYNMVKWHKIGELSVPVSTLDEVVFGHRANQPNVGEFIKIDTQGTELEILQSGERTLTERSVAVVSEVSFAELYEGQGLFSELEQYLRSLGFTFYGFELFRLRSCNRTDRKKEWSRERAIQADAVFFKDPLPGTPGDGLTLSPRQQKALIVTAVLLEYYEFALELADAFVDEPVARQKVHEWIRSSARLDIAAEQADVEQLAATVASDPDRTPIAVGAFVDARRHRNDVAKLLADEAAARNG